ncbi:TPA: alcohol dehydrogenase [Candidatus Poribacteria bacterium]|nr:alcohol dehydrogenase [Candidatus Poribacteria bacterium]
MLKKTRISVLEQFNKPLNIREIEIPELSQGQILVKITSAGVCGSDVHMFEGKDPRVPLPMILGHEGVGVVVNVNGEKKTVLGEKVKEGDPIIWNRGVLCGKCYYCVVVRQPALCENRWAYGIHRSINIPPYLNGCYAEHIILSEKTDIFLLDNRDPAVYVPVSCSGATSAHAFEYARINPGDTVLIQGPGPLGIFLVAYSKLSGAGNIIVIGGTQDRLEMCYHFGATHIINRKTHNKEQIKEIILSLTNGRGVDTAFEASGSLDAIVDGIPLVRIGGTYITAGFGEPAGDVQFPWFEYIIRKNITLQGVWVSDTRHVLHALRTVQANFDAFSKMITHRFSLEDATNALKSVAERKAMKAVIIPS